MKPEMKGFDITNKWVERNRFYQKTHDTDHKAAHMEAKNWRAAASKRLAEGYELEAMGLDGEYEDEAWQLMELMG